MKKHRQKEYDSLCESLRNKEKELIKYVDKLSDIRFEMTSIQRKLNQIEIEQDLRGC